MIRSEFIPVCLVTLCLIGSTNAVAQSNANARVTRVRGETMATYYQVTVRTEQLDRFDHEKDGLQRKIDSLLESIESRMSNWRSDSEVSRFNRSDSTGWFPVSDSTAIVVKEALRVAALSGGAFDPTVSPLIRLWSFGEDEAVAELPSATAVQEALDRIGWQKLQVRNNPAALRKSHPELEINLSAIAKGYAVDVVSDWLFDNGFRDHLVDIGGENRARGRKSERAIWTIGIQDPAATASLAMRLVRLDDQAVATSGDYRNYFVHDGQRYSHTIDPKTGRPVDHNLASVSVIAETCMTADALATAITVLGPAGGAEFVQKHQLSALLLERDDDGFREQAFGAFANGGPSISDAKEGPSAEGPSFLKTLVLAIALVAVAIAGMAVGVIFSNRRLKGTCGGLSSMTGSGEHSPCELCTTPAEECPNSSGDVLKGDPSSDSASPVSTSGDVRESR